MNPVRTPGPHAISRRALLSVAMAAPFLLSTRELFAQSTTSKIAPITPEGLHALSIVVIGPKADDRALSDAFHKAFMEVNPDFLVRTAALADQIGAASLSTPAAFSASSLAQDEVLRATAVALTAAWYLGHVAHDEHDDHGGGKVVAYEKSLMWTPTSDITVIPSYSRGAPDYWAEQTDQIEGRSKGL